MEKKYVVSVEEPDCWSVIEGSMKYGKWYPAECEWESSTFIISNEHSENGKMIHINGWEVDVRSIFNRS